MKDKKIFDISKRNIFCADNIDILSRLDSNSVDLIYLDPPFNKNKIFYGKKGSKLESLSFNDNWKNAEVDTKKINIEEINNLINLTAKINGLSSANYLYFIAIRIIELRRILKDNGSIYLHCDNTMSHYLKLLLDIIFGGGSFRNEIVWSYSHGGRGKKNFAKKHDIIFWYSKDKNNYKFNYADVLVPFESKMTEWSYTKGAYAGKPMPKGKVPEDVWNIGFNSMSKEHIGYPTQKPIELLLRIIKSSSNENDTVLDPFCGCSTTLIAAEKLNRNWIGIDISTEVYSIAKDRINNEFDKNAATKIIKDLQYFNF